MRKINPDDFNLARRSTSRDINRQIALNLIREHQPVSRAELARRMRTTRGVVGLLVNSLLEEGLIYEDGPVEALRGRRPITLRVRTRDRLVVGIDVRLSRIYLMLCDFAGRELAFDTMEPILSAPELVASLAERVLRMVRAHAATGVCEGVGVVFPGMVDYQTGRVLNAPLLGWRNVEIRDPLRKATGLPVFVESAAKACALAQMWLGRDDAPSTYDFIYVSISDGVGTGLVIGGELIRGASQIAGEFGHVPLGPEGPQCACGAKGCWMAYTSNLATIARYLNRDASQIGTSYSVTDVIARARSGDSKALEAIRATARYLGLGLVTIIHAINPGLVWVGGEITAAWDIVEPIMRGAILERALTDGAANTIVRPSKVVYPRLRGAAALVAAPTFAAPRVA